MIEMLVGLEVTNDESYSRYREGMTPLLHEVGGGFGYDFKIAEVLKSKEGEKINRVFTIFFPGEEVMKNFFKDAEYLRIKEEFFKGAVNSTTIISTYERS